MLSIAKNEALTQGFMALHIMSSSGVFPANADIRKFILELEEELATLPQVDVPVEHFFAAGVYIRQMHSQKFTLATGGISKTDSISIISSGAMLLLNDCGEASYVKAPCTFITKSGSKRVAFFLEDTVWSMTYATNETDVGKIKALVLANNFDNL